MTADIITYMWNLKKYPNEFIYKTETDSQMWKIGFWLSKGKVGKEERSLESGLNMYTLVYIRQMNSKVLLHSTGDYIQYHMITYDGKASEKRIYIYIWITSLCTRN